MTRVSREQFEERRQLELWRKTIAASFGLVGLNDLSDSLGINEIVIRRFAQPIKFDEYCDQFVTGLGGYEQYYSFEDARTFFNSQDGKDIVQKFIWYMQMRSARITLENCAVWWTSRPNKNIRFDEHSELSVKVKIKGKTAIIFTPGKTINKNLFSGSVHIEHEDFDHDELIKQHNIYSRFAHLTYLAHPRPMAPP